MIPKKTQYLLLIWSIIALFYIDIPSTYQPTMQYLTKANSHIPACIKYPIHPYNAYPYIFNSTSICISSCIINRLCNYYKPHKTYHDQITTYKKITNRIKLPCIWLYDTIKYKYGMSHNAEKTHPEIFKLFTQIKNDLGIKKDISLRIMIDNFDMDGTTIDNVYGLYCKSNNTIYLSPAYLDNHPSNLIATLTHELEHYRQFNYYQNSFHPTTSGCSIIRQDIRPCEHEADRAIANYIQCYHCLHICALEGQSLEHLQKGYFDYLDYLPYILYYLISGNSCKAHHPINYLLSLYNNTTFQIFDYLPKIPTISV